MTENTIILNVTPVPAPRQVRSDAWRKRECVLRYRAFRDELRLRAREAGYKIEGGVVDVVFVLPIPPSKSKKQKSELIGQPHTVKPDADNLGKAYVDTLLGEDSHIHTMRFKKVWGERGAIIINL